MSDKRINIEAAFLKMSDIAGFKGIVFISSQGTVLAEKFAAGSAAPRAAAEIAGCLTDLSTLVRKITPTALEEMTFRGRQGMIIVLRNRSIGFMIAVVGKENMHPGLAWLKTRETMEEMEKSLDQLMAKPPSP